MVPATAATICACTFAIAACTFVSFTPAVGVKGMFAAMSAGMSTSLMYVWSESPASSNFALNCAAVSPPTSFG